MGKAPHLQPGDLVSKVELFTCFVFAHHSIFPDFCLGPSYLLLSKIRIIPKKQRFTLNVCGCE